LLNIFIDNVFWVFCKTACLSSKYIDKLEGKKDDGILSAKSGSEKYILVLYYESIHPLEFSE
jgi:hypothetical protein